MPPIAPNNGQGPVWPTGRLSAKGRDQESYTKNMYFPGTSLGKIATGQLRGGVFWWTHGWTEGAVKIMVLPHAATLDNSHPGFTFQCSCTNSAPEDSVNLSYSLLKNGAINTVGGTQVTWYWVGQTSFAGTPSNSGMTYEYAVFKVNFASCGNTNVTRDLSG